MTFGSRAVGIFHRLKLALMAFLFSFDEWLKENELVTSISRYRYDHACR